MHHDPRFIICHYSGKKSFWFSMQATEKININIDNKFYFVLILTFPVPTCWYLFYACLLIQFQYVVLKFGLEYVTNKQMSVFIHLTCRQQSGYFQRLQHLSGARVNCLRRQLHCELKNTYMFCRIFYKIRPILKKWYTLSWLNLSYRNLNVFHLTWIVSMHCLVKLSINTTVNA